MRYQLSLVVTLVSAVAVSLLSTSSTYARDLTSTSWGGSSQAAQQKVYYEPFRQMNDIALIEDSWSGGIGILRAKVEGGQANWDVVQVEVDELILGCEEGLFEKLDWDKLGGRNKFVDTAVHDCGVGSSVWSVVLGYDGDRIKDGPKSWADFWDVEKFPGRRGMRKGAKFTLEIALLADGVAPKDVYKVLRSPEGIDRAFKKLDELKPHIVWWSSASQAPDMLASGEVTMTSVTASRLITANRDENKNFKVLWNGSIYSTDFWVILKNSVNKENAMKLIAFMTASENQKRYPNFNPVGMTNKAAIEEVDPAVRSKLPTTPENLKNAIAIDAEFWVENSDRLNKRYNVWASQ